MTYDIFVTSDNVIITNCLHMSTLHRGQNERRTMKQALKTLMEKEGVTAYKLAQDIGVNRSAVSLWLSGQRLPGFSNIMKLCTRFDVPIGYFFEELK